MTPTEKLIAAERLLEEWIDKRTKRLTFTDKQELIPIRDLLFVEEHHLARVEDGMGG